jgi:hypothetical protein
MASPSMTFNAAGNLLPSASLAASASTNFTFDVSAKFEGQIQFGATFGTIAAVAGLQVQVYRRIGSTPVPDTVPATAFTLAAVAGAQAQSIALGVGRYRFVVTNLDGTNGLTSVYATADTVDAVA